MTIEATYWIKTNILLNGLHFFMISFFHGNTTTFCHLYLRKLCTLYRVLQVHGKWIKVYSTSVLRLKWILAISETWCKFICYIELRKIIYSVPLSKEFWRKSWSTPVDCFYSFPMKDQLQITLLPKEHIMFKWTLNDLLYHVHVFITICSYLELGLVEEVHNMIMILYRYHYVRESKKC